ncbi:MAG: efflux RND transporter periplasmic adaptor subunit [Chloroflexi bacterium]|nr:efflux RND transporter periplasmic adaptor subunit [Chloroflexota bacterium]
MNLSRQTFIILGVVLVVIAVGLVIAVPRLMPQDANAKNVQTATVRRGTLTATVSATGAISPLREAQLAFTTSGTLTKLDVKQGDVVKAGQVIATLDTRELDLQLAQSEASLASAQAKLDQLKNPSLSDVAAAQASVASAEAALAQLKSPNPNDIAMAKSDLDKAAAALARAQSDYDRIGGATNPMIGMLPQALTLQQATSDYQKAQAGFNAKLTPTDTQTKQAQANLEQARSQLNKLTTPNPNDVKATQANIDQARAARDLAKIRLDYAVLKAPFDGIITHVDFDLGSTVPAGKVLLAVADQSELRVKVNIDETDIAQIKVGQSVQIRLDAYPEAHVTAKVTDVAAVATTVQGVVNYVVTVSINPSQVPLKIGMTADANIVVANKENVLLVPNQAVRGVSNRRYVTIQTDPQQTKEIEVNLGMANDQESEVISGLEEGQTVVIPLSQQLPMGGPFGSPR